MDRTKGLNQLSIVIPTLNETENLPLLLADLRLWDEKLEIIIVDGGSTDLTEMITNL